MRFSATALLALAATVVATNDDFVTVTETEYSTYCPASSSAGVPQVSESVPAGVEPTLQPGFTTTRPLITSTITRCNECPTSTPVPAPIQSPTSSQVMPVVPSSMPVIKSSSTPVIPSVPVSSATPSGSASPSGSPSGSSPSAPLFTAGASRAAAGAGMGLATVFSLVAYLL